MRSQRTFVALVTWMAMLLPLGLAGCGFDQPCDDGQELRDGYCYPVAPVAFGQTCASGAECGKPADYCAIQPGQTSGFCTAFGCDQDAAICPATWTCMDLTPYGLAAHMCAPPSQ